MTQDNSMENNAIPLVQRIQQGLGHVWMTITTLSLAWGFEELQPTNKLLLRKLETVCIFYLYKCKNSFLNHLWKIEKTYKFLQVSTKSHVKCVIWHNPMNLVKTDGSALIPMCISQISVIESNVLEKKSNAHNLTCQHFRTLRGVSQLKESSSSIYINACSSF